MEQQKLKTNDKKVEVASKTDGNQAITHSYSIDELDAICEHLNYFLTDDEDLKQYLPIEQHEKLFDIIQDGILLCKLVNKAQPGTIDQRAINTKSMNIFRMNENLNLAIQSSKSIGCRVVNIHPQSIHDKREYIILGLFWQIIKAQMLGNIDLLHHPYLIRLKKEEEELEDLLKLPKDQLLLRWINYHLNKAGHDRQVNNFTSDLKDGVNYTVLLNQLNSSKCDTTGLQQDEQTRQAKVISDSQKLGVPRCIKPSDIAKERQQINQLFLAHIFNNCPGLEAQEQELQEAAKLIDDDNQDQSREQRVYMQWINSMGLDDVNINNLISDLKDGIILCKVLNHMQPDLIPAKMISTKTKLKINQVQNANLAVENSKKLGCQIIGIGGIDIVDGKHNLVSAILWQLMRKYILDKLGNPKEDAILKWANSKLVDSDQVRNLKTKSLANSNFLFKLCDAVAKGIVDWDSVTPGENEEDVMNNAKYAISVVRKMGGAVYLVWEHIRDVNPKFLLIFIATIKYLEDNPQQ